jgi:hypothetical protein
MSASGKTYKLSGSASELSKLVNHKVQISGRLDSASSSSATESAPGSAAGGASSSKSGSDMPQVRVTSVKDVASSCSSGG